MLKFIITTHNKNDKRFNNRVYSLFFLMGIFLTHLQLIPNILKWQDYFLIFLRILFKIFTKQLPSQTPSRSSHQRCSVKKMLLKIYKISHKNTCVGVFLNFIKKRLQHRYFRVKCANFKNTYFEEYLQTTASALPRIYKT